jgi:hypothetical protein
MWKSGYGYHVDVWSGNEAVGYYVHGNCFGHRPGGVVQSVFVPQKEGFMQFFQGLLKKYSHERNLP